MVVLTFAALLSSVGSCMFLASKCLVPFVDLIDGGQSRSSIKTDVRVPEAEADAEDGGEGLDALVDVSEFSGG